MNDNDKLNMIRLQQYVNKASDLAEAVQAEIKTNGTMSMKVVLALHDFQKAADRVKKMLVIFEELSDDIN